MNESLRTNTMKAAIIGAGVLASTTLLAESRKYDPGASDTEIKVGQTMPYSGPVSAFSVIGKVQAAYFHMINDRGGINGRKINLISYDDAATPPKTVEQVRKLIEDDEVLFTFQTLGNASNIAIQKYLNDRKIPQLFVAGRATRFEDPVSFPWTMGFAPNLRTEIRVYARFILENYPSAKGRPALPERRQRQGLSSRIEGSARRKSERDTCECNALRCFGGDHRLANRATQVGRHRYSGEHGGPKVCSASDQESRRA
jgi:hypothetical protein